MAGLLTNVLWLTSLLGVSQAIIVIRLGSCPQVPVQPTLNISAYTGVWWEYQRFPAPFEIRGICGSAQYAQESADTVTVLNSGLQDFRFLGMDLGTITAEGKAVVVDPNEPAKLRVSFDGMPEQFQSSGAEANYFVIETDYETYSLVYSCSEIGFINIQMAWILTREQGVPPPNLDYLKYLLSSRGVDITPFFTVNQREEDCGLVPIVTL